MHFLPCCSKGNLMKKRKFYSIVFSLVFSIILIYCSVKPSYGAEEKGHVPATSEFYLGPEDLLEISVWNDETLSKQVVVRPDGKISFPLIGEILVQGRTVEEVRQEIENKVRVYVPDAPLTVMVIRVSSPKVYVVGKVVKPGLYIMPEPLRVIQVLAIAGGITPFSDKDDILIIREENGGQKIIKFDYSRVADGKDLTQNIYLNNGDTVVVP
jgi:polysaccharide export outer membrane protein